MNKQAKEEIPEDIKAMRQLLLIYWIFLFLAVLLGPSENSSLPDILRVWNQQKFESDDSMSAAMGSAAMIILMGEWIISYGIWNLKAWARQANLYLMGFSFILIYFLGVQILGPVSSAIQMVGTLAWGAMTGLSFFGKSSEKFK